MNSRILTRIGPRPAITLLAGLALTGVLTQQRAASNEEVASRRFSTLATRIQHDIVVQFERYEYGLNGARGVVMTGGEQGLTRSMMAAYAATRQIEREFPGARGFGFIRRVPLNQERRFLRQARADGAPQFAIKQLAPNVLERFVIQYIEPKADNQQAIGLDIGSERNRREAAVTAMRTGEATLSGPITLVQATGATLRSFLVVLPVYRPQSVLATPEQRWAAGFGWTYAPLVIDEVLRTVDLQSKSVALTLTDATQADRPEVFYAPDAAGAGRDSAAPTGLATTLKHRLFGRSWTLGFQAKPAFYDELNLTSPPTVAAWGALLTGLIALLHGLWLAMGARRRESAQAQARLATIVANASDAIIGEGVDGRIMLWNAAAEKLFGRSLADVEGQALAKLLLPPDRSDEDQALIARIVAGESISPFETTRLHRAGHLIPVAMTACAIADGQGRVIGVAKLLRDISERKGHEARLLNLNAELESRVEDRTREVTSTKEMLKTVLNAVPMMISYWDKSKILRVANRAYCDFLGHPEAELIGRPGDEVTKPGVWAAVEPFVDAVLRGQEQRLEFTAMPSGGTRRLELQAQLLPQIDQGETTGFYAISQDLTEPITQRKLLEATLNEQQIERETLRESQAFLERVSRVAGVGGWMYDLQSQHFTWSGQTCRLMDAPEGHSPSIDVAMALCVEGYREELVQAIQAASEHQQHFDVILQLRTFSGRLIWGRVVGEPLSHTDGSVENPTRLIGAFQDISAQQAASQALNEAKLAADAASQSKSMFLANMSHEIRTPLNAVLGISYLLSDSALDPDQRRLLDKAQMAGRSLLGIVNDVLDLSKIEAGEMALTEAPYQPQALLEELVLAYTPQANARQIELLMHIDNAVPPWVVGDLDRVRQILVNLIGNAIKFTSEGSVRLNAASVHEEEGQRLRYAVHDTGIGIAPDAQDGLFEPFIQADPTTTRQYGGTGLGLSIVKQLAESMAGTVGLSSRPGAGSHFWIDLPLKAATEIGPDSGVHALKAIEVAVVDDNMVDRMALAAQVKSLGWRALPVASGEDLLELLTQRTEQGLKAPDALLVDGDMPGLNGAQALSRIADEVGRDKLPPALIVSAHERAQIASPEADLLADQILSKPLQISTLFDAVSRSLVQRDGNPAKLLGATDVMGSSAQWLVGAQVLLVDDSEINLEIARRLLERQGAQVQTCTDGLQALHKLEEANHGIELVLMDVQMPVMDGLDATRAIRANPAIARLPIIAVTAGALKEEKRRVLASGMNDFLAKPLDPNALVRMVRQHIERHRDTPLPIAATRPVPGALASWPQIEGIHIESAAGQLGGDLELFIRMLGWLLNDYRDLPAELAPAGLGARLQDPLQRQHLSARVHKLRGTAGTLGAHALKDAATATEAALQRPGADASAAARSLLGALLQLTAACQPVIEALAPQNAAAPPISPLSQAALDELRGLLGAQDFAALDRFYCLESALNAGLPASDFAALQTAVSQLDFASALTHLPTRITP
jgi:PAS domain S-box-containing protein